MHLTLFPCYEIEELEQGFSTYFSFHSASGFHSFPIIIIPAWSKITIRESHGHATRITFKITFQYLSSFNDIGNKTSNYLALGIGFSLKKYIIIYILNTLQHNY